MHKALALVAAAALLTPVAVAQLPHPHPQLVHHPLTIESELHEIEAINPDFATLGTFGESLFGWPLWMMDVYNPAVDPAALPVLYLDANHHGNEQLGMESAMIFLDELVTWSTTDEGAARLGEVRVVVAPAINPDGTGTDRRVNNNGVDLNRNYDYNWGLYGTSDMMNPVTGTYRGPSPLSEPETQANAALMQDLLPDLYLSMHTGSHDIVLPWRQAPDADGPMPDWPTYEKWLARIEEVSGLGYRDPSGAGESISYAYGQFGALSLVVEVDELQFVPLLTDDPRDILAEEVAIFWDAVENLELYGGYLEAHGSHIQNVGYGNATSVVFLDRHGEVLVDGVLLEPTEGMQAPAGTVAVQYERRIQGDMYKPVWRLDVTAAGGDDGEASTPWAPALALLALAAAAFARRRTG